MIPGLRRSPGEGKDYPLQYSGEENSMDCTVQEVANSWTRLSDPHFHFSKGYESSSKFCQVLKATIYSVAFTLHSMLT